MDLGIRGKNALVCAASKGLGRGCAMSLAREGANLVITARGRDALEATAEEIRSICGMAVTAVASSEPSARFVPAALTNMPGVMSASQAFAFPATW